MSGPAGDGQAQHRPGERARRPGPDPEKSDLRAAYIGFMTSGLGGPQRTVMATERLAAVTAILTCGGADLDRPHGRRPGPLTDDRTDPDGSPR